MVVSLRADTGVSARLAVSTCLAVSVAAGALAIHLLGAAALSLIVAAAWVLLISRLRLLPRRDVTRDPFVLPVGVVAAVGLALSALDWNDALSRQGVQRYLPALVAAACVLPLLGKASIDGHALRWADMSLLMVACWGAVGGLVAKTLLSAQTTLVATCLAAGFAVIPAIARQGLTPRQVKTTLRLLGALATAFAGMDAAAALTHWKSQPLASYSHEQSYILVLAILATSRLRWWPALALNVVAAALAFTDYPALTYVVAGGTVLIVVALIKVPRRLLPHALLLTAGGIATASIAGSAGVSHYFSSAGKANNTAFRESLWRMAVLAWKQHPLLGTGFLGDTDQLQHVNGAYSIQPTHNDYLQLAVSGGAVCVILFLAWLALQGAGWIAALRARATDEWTRSLLLATTTSVLVAFVSASFNPLLTRPVTALTIFGLAGVATACARSTPSE